MDAFPKGAHLVMCYPGGKSTFYNINPNYAAMIAASRVAADKMCKVIGDASDMKREKDNNTALTNEQDAAWQHFVAVMGERGRFVHYNSIRDIAEVGIKALEEEAEKLMTHPAVRNAYEQFLTVCELCKKQDEI
jgi:roadblock/LC7 domain-containing protein